MGSQARPALPLAPVVTIVALLASSDARARSFGEMPVCIETPLIASLRPARVAAWADRLQPIDVENTTTLARTSVRLYAGTGEIDGASLASFQQAAAREGDDPRLATRLVQLVFKAAYHFGGARVVVVSGWRAHAGKHSAGEALDFKLKGVRAARLAAYLRGLSRVGVGIYTHPRTQYVHLDVREPSFHWIDASPPGVRWREAAIWDRGIEKRDAAWVAENDLP
jgi:uncharacterized protein YcbK (DUF882 family)